MQEGSDGSSRLLYIMEYFHALRLLIKRKSGSRDPHLGKGILRISDASGRVLGHQRRT